MSDVPETAEALRRLKREHERRTGQPELSIRALQKQMRDAGCGVSQQTLNNLFRGTYRPDARTNDRLCRFFGVPALLADERQVQILSRLGEVDERDRPAVEEAVLRLIDDNRRQARDGEG